MNQEIRILLVDDHSLFRESLSRLLQAEPDLRVAATSSSIPEALAALEREAVDLVLLDQDLGEGQGTSFIEVARQKGFAGRILMVTAGMSDVDTLGALESGCAGIFLKHSPPAQLVDAIHRVMNGETWVDSKAVPSLVSAAAGRSQEQRTAAPLSARERAVLDAVMEGLTNKEIAARLAITESGVKWILQQLFDKAGVRTRSQLVRFGLELPRSR